DENVSRIQLQELLTSAGDDEVRYGAFRALRALEDHHPAVQGELLNEAFWLHRVASNAPALVHLSSQKRAEVVLFGQEQTVKAPFSFLAGEFAITAVEGDDRCTVTRVPLRGGSQVRLNCPTQLEAIIKTMARLGGQYPEVVELIQQAESCQC